MNNKKSKLSLRQRVGSYSFISIVILLAILAVAMLAVCTIPSRFTIFDTTSQGALTLSDETEDFVRSVRNDITIYYVCEGNMTEPTLETLLGYYEDLNPRITVKTVDPLTNPEFTNKYFGVKSDESTSVSYLNYSLVVESELRHSIVFYDSISYYLYNGEQVGYWSVQYALADDSYAEQAQAVMTSGTELFDAEFGITSAIDYVTCKNLPAVFTLGNISESLLEDYDTLGINTTRLEIGGENTSENTLPDRIPDHCVCLLIGGIDSQISEREAGAIDAYLERGGKVILLTSPNTLKNCANLMKVIEKYSVKASDATIYAGDSNKLDLDIDEENAVIKGIMETVYSENYSQMLQYYYQMYGQDLSSQYTYEAFKESTKFENLMTDELIATNAHSITIAEAIPSDTKISIIASSAKDAYLSTDGTNKVDTDGGYVVGVTITKAISESKTAEIIWLASDDFFSDDSLENSSFNKLLSESAPVYFGITGNFESEYAKDIEPVNFSVSYLDLGITEVVIFAVIFIAIIPVGVFAYGLVTWIIRKRR